VTPSLCTHRQEKSCQPPLLKKAKGGRVNRTFSKAEVEKKSAAAVTAARKQWEREAAKEKTAAATTSPPPPPLKPDKQKK